jgi:hypothetical protein
MSGDDNRRASARITNLNMTVDKAEGQLPVPAHLAPAEYLSGKDIVPHIKLYTRV